MSTSRRSKKENSMSFSLRERSWPSKEWRTCLWLKHKPLQCSRRKKRKSRLILLQPVKVSANRRRMVKERWLHFSMTKTWTSWLKLKYSSLKGTSWRCMLETGPSSTFVSDAKWWDMCRLSALNMPNRSSWRNWVLSVVRWRIKRRKEAILMPL